MNATTTFGTGWVEVLMFLLSGGGFLGLPPGERDDVLLRSAPQQSLVYIEWAGRGPGKEGAAGVDGFVADPEIKAFFQALDKSLVSGHEPANDPDQEPRQSSQQDMWLLVKELMAKPGCLYVTIDAPPPAKGILNIATPGDIFGRIHVSLVSSAGKNSAAILESFNRAAGTQVSADPRMEQAATSFGRTLTVHHEGDRLIFGLGTHAVEQAAVALRGELKGLDSNSRFASAWKRVGSSKFASAVYIDVRGLMNATVNSLGPAGVLLQGALRGSGADALDYVVSGTSVANGTVYQRTFIATAGRTDGVLMLAGSPAIRFDQLRHIPADCDLFAATSLNLGQVVVGVRDLVSKTTPLSAPVFDQAVKELETELGLKLEADVFPAFGSAWTAFNSPSYGGVGGTSLILAVEVNDHEKAKLVFSHLMQLLEQSLATDADSELSTERAELKSHEFLGHSISYVERHVTGLAVEPGPSARPSFCLTKNHLLFSLHPQAMKSHLRFLASRQPGFDTVAAGKLSLSDQQLLTATFLDGRRAAQFMSSLAPFLGPVVLQAMHGDGFEFDQFSIPSTAALLPYMDDATLSVARQRDGIILESKNPQIAAGVLTVLVSARSWMQSAYSILQEIRARRIQRSSPGGLGPAEGSVVPAAASTAPKAPAKSTDIVKTRLVPLVIRAFVPEDVQPLIPNDILDRLSAPPSPAVQQQREERRQRAADRRLERLERRRGPLGRPASPTPPKNNTPTPIPPTPNPPPSAPGS